MISLLCGEDQPLSKLTFMFSTVMCCVCFICKDFRDNRSILLSGLLFDRLYTRARMFVHELFSTYSRSDYLQRLTEFYMSGERPLYTNHAVHSSCVVN